MINPTAGSSKTGGPLAAAWAIVHYLGEEGYKKIVKEVMDATRLVIEGISGIEGIEVAGQPNMCMFSIYSTTDRLNVYRLADEMKIRGGWYLQPQFARGNSRSCLHISFSCVNVPKAEQLLKDLRETVQALLDEPPKPMADYSGLVKNLSPTMDEATLFQLMEMAGIATDTPPERMEDINRILEALPADLSEFILIAYLNNMQKAG